MPVPYEINDTVEGIYSVVETDHVMALAKLRIELEKILFKILRTQEDDPSHKMSLFSALRYMEKNNLIDKRYISPTRDVISICNRAIHGDDVEKKVAENIIDIGIDLLKNLHKEFYDLTIKPSSSEQILPKDRDEYMEAKYRVTTVIPIVEEPYTNRYVFNQEQLDQFLENYDEFAEFLVEIKKEEN